MIRDVWRAGAYLYLMRVPAPRACCTPLRNPLLLLCVLTRLTLAYTLTIHCGTLGLCYSNSPLSDTSDVPPQLCGLPEPALFRRVQQQLPGAVGAAVAKALHSVSHILLPVFDWCAK